MPKATATEAQISSHQNRCILTRYPNLKMVSSIANPPAMKANKIDSKRNWLTNVVFLAPKNGASFPRLTVEVSYTEQKRNSTDLSRIFTQAAVIIQDSQLHVLQGEMRLLIHGSMHRSRCSG